MGVSLDGYIEDARGNFDWAAPPDDVHRYANEQAREAAAFLYGRRIYELMEGYWPAVAARDDVPEVEAEFARAYVDTPRIVFSDTLASVADGARLVRSADAAAEVARLKEETDGHLDVGGAGLAATLVDLIDEFQPIVNPVAVGGGKPVLPAHIDQLRLELVETRTFSGRVVLLRYQRAA
jgi:dihydrofolate reductase